LQEPLEIVDQGKLDHLRREGRALGIDKLTLEFLSEQHRPELLTHSFEEFGADPRTFPADDLDPLDLDPASPVS
jgi:hypothetical protein